MHSLIERVMNLDNWPDISTPENLELLDEIANDNYTKGDFGGRLAATLIFHQIVEAMCIHVLEDCHFQIQLSVFPAEIELDIPSDRMLGYYINALQSSISFEKKELFLEKVRLFNSYRNSIVHQMRKGDLNKIEYELAQVKFCFDEIYDLYIEIQDDFRVSFHGFKKDVFIDYLSEDEYEKYFG